MPKKTEPKQETQKNPQNKISIQRALEHIQTNQMEFVKVLNEHNEKIKKLEIEIGLLKELMSNAIKLNK